MGRFPKESYRALLVIAEQQQGLFTAKQAQTAGYSDEAMVYQARSGNWIRMARGVYRLADYPATARPDLVLWSLWSRGVDDIPQGVYSHQTALSIFELTDLMPARLHLTVPRKFRRRSSLPGILVIHLAELRPEEVTEMEGFRVTRPLKSIIDLLENGDVPAEVLRGGLAEGLRNGSITLDEARIAARAGLLRELADQVK